MGKLLNGTSNTGTNYYVFASHPYSWVNEDNPPIVTAAYTDAVVNSHDSMLFGKRLASDDFRFMAPRYNWESTTVYDQYSNYIENTGAYYVITDENKVYKCLYNAKGTPSTIKPTLTQNTVFKTSDDYVWKFLYDISTVDMNDFATNTLIPVLSNEDVVSSTKKSIDVIDVVSGGFGYTTVNSGLIRAAQNATTFRIEDTASLDNGYYKNSALYITSGPGAGSLAQINEYVANNTGNWVLVDKPLTTVVPLSSGYRIAPHVRIVGDGTGAQAISMISNNFSIDTVEIISSGEGYTRASVSIVANTFYGTGASVMAYVAPGNGHGSDPVVELGCTHIGINTKFVNSESNTIPTECSYRRYGILQDPLDTDGSPYGLQTFSQVLKCTTSPAITFNFGSTVTGKTSNAVGRVAHSNTSVLFLTGDKTFVEGEELVSSSGQSANIATIITSGHISRNSGQIMYINNITEKPRSNTSTEVIKLAIKV